MLADVCGQDQRETELRTAQRGPRDFARPRLHDVVKLGRHVMGLARIAIAEVIQRDINDELVNRLKWAYWSSLPQGRRPQLR